MGYVSPIIPEQNLQYRRRVNSHRWRQVTPVERMAKYKADEDAQRTGRSGYSRGRGESPVKGKTIDEVI